MKRQWNLISFYSTLSPLFFPRKIPGKFQLVESKRGANKIQGGGSLFRDLDNSLVNDDLILLSVRQNLPLGAIQHLPSESLHNKLEILQYKDSLLLGFVTWKECKSQTQMLSFWQQNWIITDPPTQANAYSVFCTSNSYRGVRPHFQPMYYVNPGIMWIFQGEGCLGA